jgi:hypothetical protein
MGAPQNRIAVPNVSAEQAADTDRGVQVPDT